MERPREVYRECMRNHAAKLGTYASDGCCEYTPDDGHPAALLCAACGCHRNFHRKAFLDAAAGATGAASPHVPILPSPGAPPGYMHMAMAGGAAGMGGDGGSHSGGRRRTRTKFTEEQKARMLRFAERLEWRMPKRVPGRAPGDDDVARFCREIAVSRQVFKVWMHNHKAGGGSGGAGAQTSSSTTRGGGGGGSLSPAMGADGDDEEESFYEAQAPHDGEISIRRFLVNAGGAACLGSSIHAEMPSILSHGDGAGGNGQIWEAEVARRRPRGEGCTKCGLILAWSEEEEVLGKASRRVEVSVH